MDKRNRQFSNSTKGKGHPEREYFVGNLKPENKAEDRERDDPSPKTRRRHECNNVSHAAWHVGSRTKANTEPSVFSIILSIKTKKMGTRQETEYGNEEKTTSRRRRRRKRRTRASETAEEDEEGEEGVCMEKNGTRDFQTAQGKRRNIQNTKSEGAIDDTNVEKTQKKAPVGGPTSKQMHTENGNIEKSVERDPVRARGVEGKGSKGHGKGGKGKGPDETEKKDRDREIRRAYAETTTVRLMGQWSAPVRAVRDLWRGGVAVARAEEVADAYRNVGKARVSAAILVKDVRALPRGAQERAEDVEVEVSVDGCVQTWQRWLVQIGHGAEPVTQSTDGEDAVIITPELRKMSAKFGANMEDEHKTRRVLVSILENAIGCCQFVVQQLYQRMDLSFAFQVPQEHVDEVLRVSGVDDLWIGCSSTEAEVLWLPLGLTVVQAQAMMEGVAQHLGMVRKDSAEGEIYGIRFAENSQMKEAAAELEVDMPATRWEVSPLPKGVAPKQLLETLAAKGWLGVELIHIDKKRALVECEQVPPVDKIVVKAGPMVTKVRIRAVGQEAKEKAKAARMQIGQAQGGGQISEEDEQKADKCSAAEAKAVAKQRQITQQNKCHKGMKLSMQVERTGTGAKRTAGQMQIPEDDLEEQ